MEKRIDFSHAWMDGEPVKAAYLNHPKITRAQSSLDICFYIFGFNTLASPVAHSSPTQGCYHIPTAWNSSPLSRERTLHFKTCWVLSSFYLKLCNYILGGITGPRSDLHAVLNVMVWKCASPLPRTIEQLQAVVMQWKCDFKGWWILKGRASCCRHHCKVMVMSLFVFTKTEGGVKTLPIDWSSGIGVISVLLLGLTWD